MSVHDVDGLNVGYAQGLLEDYLENPEAGPEEWRAVFETGDAEILEAVPGLAKLRETLREGNGAPAAAAAPVATAVEAPPPPPTVAPKEAPAPEEPPPAAHTDQVLLGAVTA